MAKNNALAVTEMPGCFQYCCECRLLLRELTGGGGSVFIQALSSTAVGKNTAKYPKGKKFNAHHVQSHRDRGEKRNGPCWGYILWPLPAMVIQKTLDAMHRTFAQCVFFFYCCGEAHVKNAYSVQDSWLSLSLSELYEELLQLIHYISEPGNKCFTLISTGQGLLHLSPALL